MIECDAVVVGAGPNGLVAANALADAGWDVVLVEAQHEIGGAVRSAEVTAPGFVTDLFSAFYPLAAASPLIRDLAARTARARVGAGSRRAGPRPATTDGRPCCTAQPRTPPPGSMTCAPGDGEAWLRPVRGLGADPRPAAGRAVHSVPAGPPRGAAAAPAGASAGTLEFARLATCPVRRLGEEEFSSEGRGSC